MWWPSTLVDVSFYRALHEPEKRAKGKLSRCQFFVVVIVATFTYSIVPVYLFPSITALSFVCWIWKDSITAQQIGSGFNGLGIGSFALDWITMSSYMDSPLAVPAFVVVNMMAGFILILYVLIPLSYWNNAYDAKRFPIFSSSIFDIDGQFYNVSRVLDDKSLTFNEEAYNNYSKLYFSASLMYSYGFTLASFTSSISHVALFYGRSIWLQFVDSYRHQMQDVHTRLMKQNYESIPRWWFYSLLFSMMGFSILVCEIFSDQLQLRYWGVLLACALVFIFLLPEGVMMATTSSEFSIKLLLEIIIGYLQSGKPIANIAFTTYGSTAINTAKYFTMDMKRAYYMKIPPKVMFLIQIPGSLLACVVSFGVQWWTLRSVKNICYPELLPKGSPWTCPWERRSFALGVTWGVIGPARMFYPHGTYSIIFIFIIIGLFAPMGVWMLSRLYPEKTWIRLINWPVIFSVGSIVPPATSVNIWSWFIVGLIFNYFVFRKFKGWWARYNYLLSVGLDSGAAFLTIFVIIFLQFRGIYGPDWWGLEMDDHCPLAHCPTTSGVIVKGCPMIN
ncbi:unnamed protein product [Musa acuminata subsp. malaccensis]|uniref:(wild Malaysian banana) hypothetical protein n=1 Tax=Musa acuminata subsp. malaccensis TaxID=214687 RepID=A0A8D7A8W9_MUSAM|nr:unnamed protein product [Musa acuminata subsp. malaccensis]